ncbi:hypothetical protein [Plantactinospora sp. KLBMP9567]|uniref:hypothetical protein n=1 Tax=Plantactinospora sp. KLBMP9567 TaxID=3085900 RepID=UPI0029827936|nr:hypothetical protein [Plantactinospora sp. KLBMP9567]MDW5330340.1 hypothetical protein [Plantactinospora sp. KLBMP9567]
MTRDPEPAPGALRWAVWLLRAEGVGLALLTLFLVYELFAATATDLLSALLVTLFAAGGAVLLWVIGTALDRRRPAARAPAIVLQLMLLPVGYFMILGGLAWLGGPLIALGLLVVGLLISTATNRALGFDTERA